MNGPTARLTADRIPDITRQVKAAADLIKELVLTAEDLEAAARLRAAGARAPLIALSANASADARPRFTFAGFDTVLPKPLDVAALGHAIERASQRPWYAIA